MIYIFSAIAFSSINRLITAETSISMTAKKEPENISAPIKLRRCILKSLYDIFKEYPYAQIELAQIKELCQTSTKELNWNMVYLEKCGYIELGKSLEGPPFIACSAVITAEGIDLIENEAEFNRRFPDEKKGSPPS
ncbi:hypothetical protein ACFL0M_05210 [Thermodesulfobacteriota bacterium]